MSEPCQTCGVNKEATFNSASRMAKELSTLRAKCAEQEELLVKALPYVEEGEQFNKESRRNLSANIRKAIGESK